jgi:hypothetical protein
LKLKNLLWIDFWLGFITGTIGILFYNTLKTFLAIPVDIIIIISVVTLAYSLVALVVAQQKQQGLKLAKILIAANWVWSVVSIILLYLFFQKSTVFGKLFLVLQIIVVGGLAYFEGKAVKHTEKQY